VLQDELIPEFTLQAIYPLMLRGYAFASKCRGIKEGDTCYIRDSKGKRYSLCEGLFTRTRLRDNNELGMVNIPTSLASGHRTAARSEAGRDGDLNAPPSLSGCKILLEQTIAVI
jgi:hypothetical protein